MDTTIFHAINGLAGHYDGIDDAFEATSRYVPFALVALLLGLWFWPGPRSERDRRQWGVIAATLAAILALGVNQVVIRLWERPRPFVDHRVTLLLSPSPDPSFPSDHATFGFAVAVALLLISRRVGIATLVVAVVLAFSRVYVGEHYLSDVLTGALIGSLAAIAVDQLRPLALPVIDPPLRLARRLRLA
jgi:undecaprenyl-diphosphatase